MDKNPPKLPLWHVMSVILVIYNTHNMREIMHVFFYAHCTFPNSEGSKFQLLCHKYILFDPIFFLDINEFSVLDQMIYWLIALSMWLGEKVFPKFRYLLVMSPSRAEGFSARLVTFFTSARNWKSAENEPKFDFQLKIYFSLTFTIHYAAKS